MKRSTLKFSSLLILCLFVASLALAGCGGGAPAKTETKQLRLTLYCGLMEDHMAKAIQEFQKDTGIKVDAVRMSSGGPNLRRRYPTYTARFLESGPKS